MPVGHDTLDRMLRLPHSLSELVMHGLDLPLQRVDLGFQRSDGVQPVGYTGVEQAFELAQQNRCLLVALLSNLDAVGK